MDNTSNVVSDNKSISLQPEELFDLSKTVSGAIYTPLQAVKQEIRLLTINPGVATDTLCAKLYTVSLNGNPVYEALSYTWGELKPTHLIMLDGKPFQVRQNLDAILRRLRLTDKSRTVWIDAVCINQDDIPERSSQVLLMGRIYTNCRRCLIWLGEQDGETEAAIRLIQLWSQGVHFGEWEHLQNDLAAVARLVERPWWSRIWTVQEVLLPAEKIMLCGGYTLSWEALILAKEALQHHSGMDCCREKSVSADDAVLDLFGRFIVVVDSFAFTSDIGFISIAAMYRDRQATDPRDKLIALLSLADPREQRMVVPDYSADLQDLYADFVVKNIREYSSLQALSSILDNPPNADLPSWVPDWRLPVHDVMYQAARQRRYEVYDACRGLRANIVTSRWRDKIVMRENGILFDTVKYVADESDDPEEESELKLKRWYEFARLALHNVYVTGESFDEAFWRTMMLDTTFQIGATPPPSIARTTPATTTTIVSFGSKTLGPRDESGYEASDIDLDQATLIFALISGIARRKFYITEHGYIGLGPTRMQVGDMVYVLSGGNWPLVLRAAEAQAGSGLPDGVDSMKELRTFVGDCYVHGIMDGELVKEREDELKPVYLI